MSGSKEGFNRLSGTYDLMLRITSGNAILRSQTTLLYTLPKLHRALIIGGGTGSFLIELLKQKEVDHITYLDFSEGMIAQAQKKLKKEFPESLSRIDFVCGTIDDLSIEKKYDAVFTNYFLDLFKEEELDHILTKTYSLLTTGGHWYLTDFAYPNQQLSGVQRVAYKGAHQLLYLFFKTICGISGRAIPDYKTKMAALKMKGITEQYFLKKLLWCGVYVK